MMISANITGSLAQYTAVTDKTTGKPGATAGGQAGQNPGIQTSGASGSSDSTSPTDQTLKQLEEQLRQIMQQIARLQASNIPEEQKSGQLQALNTEAGQLQQQIEAILQKQMDAARGVTTA